MKCYQVVLAVFYLCYRTNGQSEPSCDSKIYCQGNLLHTVQMDKPFKDSKTFVDMKMKSDEKTILSNFDEFMKKCDNEPTTEQVRQFVYDNFEDGNEVTDWKAPDYNPEPEILSRISDKSVQNFTRKLVSVWPKLTRIIKEEVLANPKSYSIIPVTNGFVVPGGRFKEFYYWDSYWVIRGLLISGMHQTTKGIINNFLQMVQQYGFIPNGGRVYYLNRSQPPLLTLMAWTYVNATGDIAWLKQNIHLLEQELNFWYSNKTVDVNKNGNTYTLAHYKSKSGSPRPESYGEDIKTCSIYTESSEISDCYMALKSGAESGWDFSSRWFFDKDGGVNTNLSNINTSRVIPVDLNSYLAQAFKILGDFYKQIGNQDKYAYWAEKSQSWIKAIEQIMYNEKDGIWYDYDMDLQMQRPYFYPSNFAPLFAQLYEPAEAERKGEAAANYFTNKEIMNYIGGIPTSLDNNGEQWDMPNAWPPLQSIVIFALEKSGSKLAQNVARSVADNVLEAYMIGFSQTNEMFEKYDANVPGQFGGGGEYTVQSGFGWTNGVAFEIVDYYYASKN